MSDDFERTNSTSTASQEERGDERPARRAYRVAFACGWITLALGATTLAGWIANDPRLKLAVGSGALLQIKSNTSIALLLGGCALLLLLPEGNVGDAAYRVRKRIGQACAALVALIGALTSLEYVFARDFGLDQLLFTEPPGLAATAAPNRMGPLAAIALLLIGSSLLLLDRRSRRGTARSQFLAFPVGLIAFIPLLGYLFGAEEFHEVGHVTSISLVAAAALCVLTLGTLCARPRVTLMSAAISDDPGGVLLRRMLPVALIVPIALNWIGLRGEQLGYFDTSTRATLSAATFCTLFSALLWWNATAISRSTQAHLRARAAQQELNSRIVAILENIAQGFYALDRDSRFTYVNREGERLSGIPARDLIGRKFADVLPASAFPELHLALGNASSKRETTHVEVFHPRLSRWHMHDIVPTQQGIALFMRDVTDQKLHEEERHQLLEAERAARTQAEHASAMKDEFLATLSHELRTPLNAILGWANLLARDDVPAAELRQGLETIERNSRLQAQLIEDLLDMSRIVSGKIRLDVQSIDLAAIIDVALATVTPAATAKRVRLQKLVKPRAGPVRGDPARLQQVLWNLLSNAIKFTNSGGRIVVGLTRVESHVELSVTDTGAGIAPEFLPYVFDRFRQGDASTTRRHGGLGLGLSIVRSLTELHGGRVRADSAGKGAGATFTIELPLTAIATPAEPPARVSPAVQVPATVQQPPAPSLDGLHVLVVDDDNDARDLIGRVLSSARALVTASDSAATALAQLDQFAFDVMVSDIGMPDSDGYELIAAVRRRTRERGGAVPAIALTALAREEDRRRTLLAGYQVHLAKPLQPATLLAAVATLAGRSKQLAAAGGGS